MRALLIAVAALATLWLLDRLLLAIERRGWIYYRRRRASPGALGNALLNVQALVDPAAAHAVEARSDEREERSQVAEP